VGHKTHETFGTIQRTPHPPSSLQGFFEAAAANAMTDHEARELVLIDEHNPLAQLIGCYMPTMRRLRW
jgi:hypothetical protein